MSVKERFLKLFGPQATNGNGRGHAVPGEEVKGVSLEFAPNVQFFSPDGAINNNIVRFFGGHVNSETERVSRATAYAAAVYAHAAIRYRMRKVAEPPLMVVQTNADDEENWLPNHPLAALLDEPSPDFDMGELLMRTQAYVDITGSALWLKELDGGGRVGRLTPYSGSEFDVESTRTRIRGLYRIQTSVQELDVPPERVVLFQEVNPTDWHNGTSLLDVAMGWLNLGQEARAAVQGILANAMFPSIIVQTDPTWRPHPDSDEWLQFQDALRGHASNARRGEPLALTGGGTATVVTPRLKDLIPADILDRVESVTSSVFGIPAIVLQFQVGMENSPWSQMAEARRMCYEDTIEPLWREREKAITRQLLWAPTREGGPPTESDRRRLVRFDTTRVRALQADKEKLTTIAGGWGEFASVNERRTLVGLDPSDDPAHDEIPDGKPAPVPPGLGGPPAPADDEADDEEETEEEAAAKAADYAEIQWKRWDALTRGLEPAWRWDVERLLAEDRDDVVRALDASATRGGAPAETKAVPDIAKVLESLTASQLARWGPVLKRLVRTTGVASAGQLSQDIGVSFDLLTPGIDRYTAREAAWLITEVTNTTKQAVRDVLQAGIVEGESIPQLARRIREADSVFGTKRATLIARTEVTRVSNGAQAEGLVAYQESTGARVRKKWLSTPDGRTRPDHREMNGVEVDVDANFNTPDLGAVPHPQAPNCRCTLTYRVER